MSARQFSLVPHRSVIAVGGPDRIEFLQGLISNDATKVAPARAIWAALLTPQGRFLNDMFVADGGNDTLLLETERERAPALARKLAMYKLRSKAIVEDRGKQLEVAVAYGPDAAEALPLENGFDELNGVDWQKGCYMGQELTARTKYRALIRKRLFPVRIEGVLPAPGTSIYKDGQEVGELRSGSGSRALAMLRLDAVKPGQKLTAGGAGILPEIPGWMRLPETTDP